MASSAPVATFCDEVSSLPPEVWLLIFQYLERDYLREIRLTCRQWMQLVDQTKSLRAAFCVVFRSCTMDRKFNPRNLYPAALYAEVDNVRLVAITGTWWSTFGAILTRLDFRGCRIALPELWALLSGTPNLEELILIVNKYQLAPEPTDLSWKLEKLKSLSCDAIFDTFGLICPRLEVLMLPNYGKTRGYAKLCHLLDSVQGTLKTLGCYFTPDTVKQIAGMSRLKLTCVLHRGKGGTAVELSRLQPSIEDLKVSFVSTKDLCEIGRNLPNLQHIRITTCKNKSLFLPSFLANMPQLKGLSITAGSERSINFAEFKAPLLKALRLELFRIESSGWRHFLANCPNLEMNDLTDCTLASWSEVFDPQPQSLSYLRLEKVCVSQNTASTISGQRTFNLKELKVLCCDDIPSAIVQQLLPRVRRRVSLYCDGDLQLRRRFFFGATSAAEEAAHSSVCPYGCFSAGRHRLPPMPFKPY